MLRIIGRDTQLAYLSKWDDMEKNTPLYLARTIQVIGSVGLMACIRALRDVDPARAEAFVKDYWLMCDAGDAFGELLWDFTAAAGLDLALVTLPPASAAVARTAE